MNIFPVLGFVVNNSFNMLVLCFVFGCNNRTVSKQCFTVVLPEAVEQLALGLAGNNDHGNHAF